MAPTVRSSRFHAERGLARHLAQRSSIAGRDSPAPSASTTATSASSTTSSKSAPAGVTLPPHGTAALVGIVVMLSLFVLGIAGWRLWVWRKKKAAAAASAAFLNKTGMNPGIFSAVGETHDMKRSLSKSSSVVDVKLPTDVKPAVTRDQFPHMVELKLDSEPTVLYPIPEKQEDRKSMAPPGITVTPAPPSLQITPPPIYAEIPKAALSPRTASRVQSIGPIAPTAKLPRLVIVESTFSTTLHDELEIREGETLRLLEEYEDEWCLVQRVGPADAEKGVVPRFCVIDKPDAPPARKSTHIPRLSTFARI